MYMYTLRIYLFSDYLFNIGRRSFLSSCLCKSSSSPYFVFLVFSLQKLFGKVPDGEQYMSQMWYNDTPESSSQLCQVRCLLWSMLNCLPLLNWLLPSWNSVFTL